MAKETEEKRMATDVTMEFIKRYSVSPKDRVETIIDTWKKIFSVMSSGLAERPPPNSDEKNPRELAAAN